LQYFGYQHHDHCRQVALQAIDLAGIRQRMRMDTGMQSFLESWIHA